MSLIALIMAAIVVNCIVQKLLLRGLERLIKGTQFANDKEIRRHNVVPRLANIIPALVISYGISYSPNMPEIVSMVLLDVVNAFIIAMLFDGHDRRSVCNKYYLRATWQQVETHNKFHPRR